MNYFLMSGKNRKRGIANQNPPEFDGVEDLFPQDFIPTTSRKPSGTTCHSSHHLLRLFRLPPGPLPLSLSPVSVTTDSSVFPSRSVSRKTGIIFFLSVPCMLQALRAFRGNVLTLLQMHEPEYLWNVWTITQLCPLQGQVSRFQGPVKAVPVGNKKERQYQLNNGGHKRTR